MSDNVISMEEYFKNKEKEQRRIDKKKKITECTDYDFCDEYNDRVELSTGETYSPSKLQVILESMMLGG